MILELLMIAGTLIGGAAAASTSAPKRKAAVFPADRWNVKPWPETDIRVQRLRAIVAEAEPALVAAGMPAAVAFGQAAVETGWFGAGKNNPWGLRGSGDAGSDFITTHEVLDHVKVKQTGQKFARFTSAAAAARGYARFLSGPRYREAWALRSRDDGLWLLWLWGVGYATATSYASSVVSASRRVAVQLNRPDLAVTWSEAHAELDRALKAAAAGPPRWKATQAALRPAIGPPAVV